MRNIAVNPNYTACRHRHSSCSAVSASSRHVLSANNYTAASGKRAFGFSPLAEISGISMLRMFLSYFLMGNV